MRAATLLRAPGPLEICDITIDDPRGREVLVRTVAAGLCHSDYHVMEGRIARPLPTVLGHESAGVVEAVGPDVTSVKVGDHVVCCLSVFCGNCRRCLGGETWLCDDKAATARPPGAPPRLSLDGRAVTPFSHVGGFAEYILVHENGTVAVPGSLPFDRAALLGCGVITGVGAALNSAQVKPGSSAVIVGCGGIGLNAVQGCVLAGAARIIAVDRVPAKLELARTFGATHVVDAAGGDAVAAVKELTGGGVDYAFEAIGTAATVEAAFAMLRRGGTAYVIGVLPEGSRIRLDGLDFLASKGIQGVYMGSNHFKLDLPTYVEWYLQGRLRLDELISAHLPLDAINDGYAALARGEVARSVIMFD
ncbi:MAG: Zn-dependent alcohol dehydrogenase [Acidimicrobiales bacterium]|nr:Zn-dependent alcohol dehydrogenase [Acidimicrobiales bacterium]